MIEQKENTGNRIIDAVLALVFILFALSYLNGSDYNSIIKTKHRISDEVILSQQNAVVNTEFQVIPAHYQEFFKIRFPEVKSICLFISENKKNDIFIRLQGNKYSNKPIIPYFVCGRHIFPPEKDEVPLEG